MMLFNLTLNILSFIKVDSFMVHFSESFIYKGFCVNFVFFMISLFAYIPYFINIFN